MAKRVTAKKNGLDAIIVGGGPGGLAIGTLLAKEGVSSAIIEKAPALGGGFALLISTVAAWIVRFIFSRQCQAL